jgi:hypothetical protein
MSRLFTVVDKRTLQPFVIQRTHRPAVVAFHNYSCAHFTARALEHREEKGCSSVDELHPAPFSLLAPKHSYLRAWDSTADLVDVSRARREDILYCTRIEARMDRPIDFLGRLFCTA